MRWESKYYNLFILFLSLPKQGLFVLSLSLYISLQIWRKQGELNRKKKGINRDGIANHILKGFFLLIIISLPKQFATLLITIFVDMCQKFSYLSSKSVLMALKVQLLLFNGRYQYLQAPQAHSSFWSLPLVMSHDLNFQGVWKQRCMPINAWWCLNEFSNAVCLI